MLQKQTVLAVLVAISVSSYANYQKRLGEEREERIIRLRNIVLANIRTVKPHVKPEHMEQCKEVLKNRGHIFGGSFRVVSDFKLSVRHSCAAGKRTLFSPLLYPAAAYVAMIQRIKPDGQASNLVTQGACGLRLKSEDKIEVFLSDTQSRSDDPCHQI